jgi:hypothetical protein
MPVIGADRTGRLLEIVIPDATEQEPPCTGTELMRQVGPMRQVGQGNAG